MRGYLGLGSNVGDRLVNLRAARDVREDPDRLPGVDSFDEDAAGLADCARDHVADLVTVESAPLRAGAADEIARVLRPGGEIRLLHPAGYAAETHGIVAAALGPELVSQTTSKFGDDMTLTVLRRAVDLLR